MTEPQVPHEPAVVPDTAPAPGYRYPGAPAQRRAPDGTPLMANGQPNPTGTGPYCAPRACYCGACPAYRPLPEIDWQKAAKKVAKRRIKSAEQNLAVESWEEGDEA